MADTTFSLYELLPELPHIEVVDVGAIRLHGQNPPYFELVLGGHARVTGFEPDLRGCVQLNHDFGRPHRFFPQFVGDGAPAKFHETNTPFTGSLYPPNRQLLATFTDMAELTQLQQVREVPTVRLDDIADIADVDFLKIDIQGAEFVELYEGQPLFADIDAHLRGSGFWFHDFKDFGSRTVKPLRTPNAAGADQGINQKLWTDAIYFKHPHRLDGLPDVKLLKLAVLLHDIYGSHDFAHFFLQAVDARAGTQIAPRYRARLAS
jgi:FkbM family methyltransferase